MSLWSKISLSRRNLTAAAVVVATAVVARKASAQKTVLGERPEGKPMRPPGGEGKKDGKGGDQSVRCMLRGTLVNTPSGERPVESLAKGDLVTTFDGKVKSIVWIGKRAIQRTPGTNWSSRHVPVRISSSAISENVPSRTVYISQDHAILVDGCLVRAGDLVNSTTIALAPPAHLETLEYYHIQLAGHDVVVTSGLAVETLNVIGASAEFDDEQPLAASGEALPILYLAGNTEAVRSRLRSAISPWIDKRNAFDKIRDNLEQRGLRKAA